MFYITSATVPEDLLEQTKNEATRDLPSSCSEMRLILE